MTAALGLNEVWREAAQRVERQAGTLFTIAAAFLLLPAAALDLAYPDMAQMAGKPITAAELRPVAPAILAVSLVQLFAQLSIIAVATDDGRSTIGAALRRAFLALPRVLLGLLALMGGIFVLTLLAGVVIGIPLALSGSAAPQKAALTLLAVVAAPVVWVTMRLALFTPAVVDETLGPLDALRRSWRVSRGRAGAIFLILALALLGIVAAQGLIGLVAGGTARAVDAMVGGHGLPQFVARFVSGAVGAAATVYFTLLLVVIWRRLRGR